MILSVSRRTDIPNYYSQWFFNRIKEGYVYVKNPMNTHQISKINISPDIVDCIVFWTKNPEPMINHLDVLKAYKYYFQFTLTGYGKDIEPSLPHKKDKMIPIFQSLSAMIGKEKVIWRYDPIFFTDSYTVEYHIKAFREIAAALKGYTGKVVISFLDIYAKTQKNMREINLINIAQNELIEFALKIAEIAKEHGLQIETCAEKIDLSSCGINHSSCIDKTLIEEIIGCSIKAKKDKNQREECGCIESVDIGEYDTCLNGCKYCYANYNKDRVKTNCTFYDVHSPLLCGQITSADRVTERAVKSIKEDQIKMINLES